MYPSNLYCITLSAVSYTHLAQSASVALDPTTGAVRGLVGRVGGTSDTTFRNFNYATQGKRSPGSTIKPLVVYALSLIHI